MTRGRGEKLTFLSYAQNFEDVMLWRALSDITVGRYLDIGAQDPNLDSVSKGFYLAGWRGVHVEPTPHYAAALRQDRPDELVIEAVVGRRNGLQRFFEVPGTGLSTGDDEVAARLASKGWEKRELAVPSLTLEELLVRLGDDPIHWMKIDVEGMEGDVLDGWGDHPARPWILVVESTVPGTTEPTEHLWQHKVVQRGYKEVYFDGLNRFFVAEAHAERGEAFASPPNVFDGFNVASHHFSAGWLRNHEAEVVAAVQGRLEASTSQATSEIALIREAHKAELEQQLDGSRVLRGELLAAFQSIALTQTETHRHFSEQRQADAERLIEELRGELDRMREERADQQMRVDAQLRSSEELVQRRAEEHSAHRDRLSSALAESRELDLTHQLEAARERETLVVQFEARIAELQKDMAAEKERLYLALSESRQLDLTHQLQATQERHSLTSAYDQRIAASDQRLAQLEREMSEEKARFEEALAGSYQREQSLLQHAADTEKQLEALVIGQARVEDKLVHASAWIDAAAGLLQSALSELPPAERKNWLGQSIANPTVAELRYLIEKILYSIEMGEGHEDARPDPANESEGTATMSDLGRFRMKPSSSESSLSALDAVLAMHDRYFVYGAYKLILGRSPDPEGASYYESRLQVGYHKLQLLKQLSASEEAIAQAADIPGLSEKIRQFNRSRTPLIGWIWRRRYRIGGESAVERQMRVLQNEIGLIRHGQQELERLAYIEGKVDSVLERIAKVSGRMASANAGLQVEGDDWVGEGKGAGQGDEALPARANAILNAVRSARAGQ